MRQQYLLKLRLKEWAKMIYFRVEGLEEVIDTLLKRGITLEKESKHGYKIIPVYGAGHWTLAEWKNFRQGIIDKPEHLAAIKEMLSKLAEVGNKPMYSKSCERNTPCNYKMDNSCFLSSCPYAAKVFEEIINKRNAGD